jgi:hypothetical protein
MDTNQASKSGVRGRIDRAVPVLVLLAVCLAPYVERLRSPSLYADDIDRVEQLRTLPLGVMLLRPFNEHLAPLFQGLTWLLWQAVGHRLVGLPLAFTLASFAAFVVTLGLTGLVVQRETGSSPAALAGVAVFSLSWLAIETVYWYSASSFLWALATTLAAWLAVAGAADRSPGRLALAAVATACAPAFSAIGLLAGPVAAVRGASGPRRSWRLVAAPLAGTLVYLGACAAWHDRAVVARNVELKAGVAQGLLAATRAPAAALLPGVIGVGPLGSVGLAGGVETAITAAAVVVLAGLALRGVEQPLLAGGLVLVVGGYGLTFCARGGSPVQTLIDTQRYHLFPTLGLVLILAPVFRRMFGSAGNGSVAGLWGATGLAVVLCALHAAEMKGRARFLKYPDQVRTLAAIDRLGQVCSRLGITRTQVLRALDPIETEWTPAGHSALVMIGPCAASASVPDEAVKPVALAGLTPSERRSVCGGMDATPYLRRGPSNDPVSVAVGRPVSLYRVAASGPGRYVSAGWPSFIEFELSGDDPADARALTLSGSTPADTIEVWWKPDGQKWSETRSIRLRPHSDPGADPTRSDGAWTLPLDQLPHWDPTGVRRVRLLLHAAGPVAVGEPRLIR